MTNRERITDALTYAGVFLIWSGAVRLVVLIVTGA